MDVTRNIGREKVFWKLETWEMFYKSVSALNHRGNAQVRVLIDFSKSFQLYWPWPIKS